MGKEIISKHYQNYLSDMIKVKSNEKIVPGTESEVFDNIRFLTNEKTSFGDEKVRWLDLNTKKMLAIMLDPTCHVEYDVKRAGNIMSCEARFYWTDDAEHPAGIGFVARDVSKQIQSDADVNVAEAEMEALVRGAAASRAYTDAGIGLEFYSDSFDTLFSSVEETEAEEVVQRKQTAKAEEEKRLVPEVPSRDEIKKRARTAASAKAEKSAVGMPMEKDASAVAEPVPSPAPEPEKEKEKADTVHAPSEIPVIAPADGSMTADQARLVVTTKGNFSGQPLGTIESARARSLIWYLTNDTAEVGAAAKLIILDHNDPELTDYMNQALGAKQ